MVANKTGEIVLAFLDKLHREGKTIIMVTHDPDLAKKHAEVIYWLKDESDRFEETTVLVDKSIDLACISIKAGIGNKVFDIGIFLFKNHILLKNMLISYTPLKRNL